MSEFIINVEYENEIRKIISEIKPFSVCRVLKSKKYIHLYEYLKLKYPQLNNGISEYLYWFVNGLTEYPKCAVCGNDIHTFYNWLKGYSYVCCRECSYKSEITKQKIN